MAEAGPPSEKSEASRRSVNVTQIPYIFSKRALEVVVSRFRRKGKKETLNSKSVLIPSARYQCLELVRGSLCRSSAAIFLKSFSLET